MRVHQHRRLLAASAAHRQLQALGQVGLGQQEVVLVALHLERRLLLATSHLLPPLQHLQQRQVMQQPVKRTSSNCSEQQQKRTSSSRRKQQQQQQTSLVLALLLLLRLPQASVLGLLHQHLVQVLQQLQASRQQHQEGSRLVQQQQER